MVPPRSGSTMGYHVPPRHAARLLIWLAWGLACPCLSSFTPEGAPRIPLCLPSSASPPNLPLFHRKSRWAVKAGRFCCIAPSPGSASSPSTRKNCPCGAHVFLIWNAMYSQKCKQCFFSVAYGERNAGFAGAETRNLGHQ